MDERILVIDDEEIILGAVRKSLRKDGYRIDTVLSAREGLERLARSPYDVVITDLMMPGMDGLDLLERIQATGARVQTIMITGFPTIQTAVRAKKLGAFEYVTKPFTREEMRSVVVRALRARELEPAPVAAARGSLYYLPAHAWARVRRDRTVEMGMARAFARTVGEPEGILVPSPGERIEQGKVCVTVFSDDGIEHSLHAPLGGRVVEVNTVLEEEPRLAITDPEGAGWLLRLQPEDLDREVQNLMPG